MDPRHEGIAQWLDEGRELVRGMQERIEYLAKENERLLSAGKANNRVQADRDHLLAAFNRLGLPRGSNTTLTQRRHLTRSGPHRLAEGSSTRVAPPKA
jgi:hypothetical protein